MNATFRSALLIAASLAAATLQAGTVSKDDPVKLDRAALAGGTVIPAGTYRVELAPDLDSARFVQGKRVVAVVPCTVGVAQAVYRGAAVHYLPESDGPDRLVKIVFGAANIAVDFGVKPEIPPDTTVAKSADRP